MRAVNNQKGQLVIEAILIMVLTLGVSAFIFQFLREKEYFGRLTNGPWSRLQGMVQCGTWEPLNNGRCLNHPNNRGRNLSYDPNK